MLRALQDLLYLEQKQITFVFIIWTNSEEESSWDRSEKQTVGAVFFSWRQTEHQHYQYSVAEKAPHK